MLNPCECEHMSHFEETNAGDTIPIEDRAHPYAKVPGTVNQPTDYGDFYICNPCKKAGHMDD